MVMWAKWIFILGIITWLLLGVVIVAGAVMVHRCSKWPVRGPTLETVKALAVTPPHDLSSPVDGVLIDTGERVLFWPDDMRRHKPALYRHDRQRWACTDELQRLVPGSVVQIERGLQFAHASFAVRDNGYLVPLWQHWLLSGPMCSQAGDTFVLRVQENDKLSPWPVGEVLK